MTHSAELHNLAGERVSSIGFGLDWIEWHFHGPYVRAFTLPSITYRQQNVTFPEAGSRDLLCSLVDKWVITVWVQEELAIYFHFEAGYQLMIPLQSQRGGEAAHFVPYAGAPAQVLGLLGRVR